MTPRERAEVLLDQQPVGRVTPAIVLPWVVKAICFLLYRYIKEE